MLFCVHAAWWQGLEFLTIECFPFFFSVQNTQFLLLFSFNNPLNWSKIQKGFPLYQNSKIINQGKFDIDIIKIYLKVI